MKNKFLNSVVVLGGVLSSASALAASEDMSSSAGLLVGLTKLAGALAVGFGIFAAAGAQGRAAGKALEGIARNPTSRGDVFVPLLISLAFIEFQALIGFIVALMILG